MATIMIGFIKIYQFFLSPDKSIFFAWLKGKICCHEPHCSQYSIEVFKKFWFFTWLFKTMDRVSRCWPSIKIKYDPPIHKVVFFSSAPIWIEFLKKIHTDKNFEIVWVVSMPAKASWRWLKIQENIITQTAKSLWIKNIFTPKKINPDKSEKWLEFYNNIKKLNPDRFVVIAYWKILPQKILDIPKIMPLNIHWSLLPKYRWASPIQSVFLDHQDRTKNLISGITLMKMIKKMDAWDIIAKLKFELPLEITSLDLIKLMEQEWPNFVNKTMINYAKWLIKTYPQNENEATYCQKIEKEQWLINPQQDNLQSIYNKYRAFYIRPKIYFILNWKRFIIETIQLNIDKINNEIKKITDKNFKKNTIKNVGSDIFSSLRNEKFELNSLIKKIQIKPEWKKVIDWESFKNWYLKSN